MDSSLQLDGLGAQAPSDADNRARSRSVDSGRQRSFARAGDRRAPGTLPPDAAARFLPNHPEVAIDAATAILRTLPSDQGALLLLASAYSLQQRFRDATDALVRAVRAHPTCAPAYRDLGLMLRRAGHPRFAISALRRAAHLDAYLPQVWRMLADATAAGGDASAAGEMYLRHVHHSTRDAELMTAASELIRGRLSNAELILRRRLVEAPTDVVAIRMMGELAARLDRPEDSVRLLARCVELAPGFAEARVHYALMLHRSAQETAALDQVSRVLMGDGANGAALALKAAILCRIGEYAAAIQIYRQLTRDHPQATQLWLSYGHALKTIGRTRDAIAAYRRCAGIRPACGEAWWSLGNLKTFKSSTTDVAEIRAQLRSGGLNGDDRLYLEFALGKALEHMGEYEESFVHYSRGNQIRKDQLKYDARDTTARVEYVCASYTREFFRQRRSGGSSSRDPIFIVGLPRSGSTLVEQILSSHSSVEGTMELPEIISITGQLRDAARSDGPMPYHRALAGMDSGALRTLGELYIRDTRIQRKTRAPFFIDKMPNNFMHIGLIHLILPNAKIIDVRRGPMACGFSIFTQCFARGQDFSYDLSDVGHYYCDYEKLMAHYDSVLPNRVCHVSYERLVNDTEGEVRKILKYCDLPFERGCMRFFDNPRAVRTASSEQVRHPIYRGALDHWKHYSKWLEPLRAALRQSAAR